MARASTRSMTTIRTTMMKRVSQFWDYNNGEYNEEENDKDDNKNKCDNNDKGISALGLEENDDKLLCALKSLRRS